MRNLTILLAILSITVCANAAITIGVSKSEMVASDTAIVSLSGDGTTPQGVFFLGITAGDPGSLDGSQMTPPPPIIIEPPPEIPGLDSVIEIDLFDIMNPEIPLAGKLVDNIIYHQDGVGFVRMVLLDSDMNIMDVQLMYEIPEPMTIALLGLGAMMLRRKR